MELAILTGDKLRSSLEKDNLPDTVSFFLDGDFEAVLKSDGARHILGQNPKQQQDLESVLVQNVTTFLETDTGNEQHLFLRPRELEVLLIASSCLQLFVQNNYLGPFTSSPPTAFLSPSFLDEQVQEMALTYLSENGEAVYNLSRFIGYLYIARIILLECRDRCSSVQTWDWWLLRLLGVQQSLLEQRAPTLKATILDTIDLISKKETLINDENNRDVCVLFHTEASRLCQLYWEDKRGREHITQACKMAGLNVELGGALGKRTRFQEEHKAQLVLRVSHNQGETTLPEVGVCNPQSTGPVPKSLALEDDTVLDSINFKEEDASLGTKLSPMEQAVLFTLMESHRRAVAQERLTDEEVESYLRFIISQVSSWSVSVSAHTMRCRMEKDSSRRVERAMQQLEELVNQIQRPEPGPATRLPLFYAARPPTSWHLQGELASLLKSLGCVGAALDIYERLQLWEDVIACYQQLGKREKAESVIREQLAAKETPSLLCFLGDVTRDMTHYQRAWELSNGRSARAMRGLAYVHFSEERFEEAVDCFEKSLAINSLQIPVWFTCGCASMAAKKYKTAVQAFRRCVQIDYDNYEAWANLATAHARLGNKRKAFLTVKDAIKCNYENWRLWENCLVFATDCGEFEEVLQAYHRLLDLKDKFMDTEVLRIVVKAVVTDMEDAGGRGSQRLLPRMLELFGRFNSKMTLDAETWKLYADLCRVETADHKPDLEKAVQYLQKSLRCVTQKPGWERGRDECHKVAQQSVDLAHACQSCAEQMRNPQQAVQMLNSAKLSLKGVVSTIKQKHTDPISNETEEPLKTDCQLLENELNAIINKVEQLRAS